MKTWYIRNNDGHLGPYSVDELKLVGLYSDDYVWKEGLPKWTKANAITELRDFLITVEHSLFNSEKEQQGEKAAPFEEIQINKDPGAAVNLFSEVSRLFSSFFERSKAS